MWASLSALFGALGWLGVFYVAVLLPGALPSPALPPLARPHTRAHSEKDTSRPASFIARGPRAGACRRATILLLSFSLCGGRAPRTTSQPARWQLPQRLPRPASACGPPGLSSCLLSAGQWASWRTVAAESPHEPPPTIQSCARPASPLVGWIIVACSSAPGFRALARARRRARRTPRASRGLWVRARARKSWPTSGQASERGKEQAAACAHSTLALFSTSQLVSVCECARASVYILHP